MNITKHDVQCVWGGTLAGILLKTTSSENRTSIPTTKILCIHGWLDNLNSLLPLAKLLIHRHPNYEIYLYDRAGHGFSSHIPRGFDYSAIHNMQDLRTVVRSLGWNKGKFSIIGHSYGATMPVIYAANYPNEVSCIVAIDALPRPEPSSENLYEIYGARLDMSLEFHQKPSRNFETDLTFEKVLELTKSTRPGITDEAARILIERSVRKDTNNKLHFTRDEALKVLSLQAFTENSAKELIQAAKAPILFIGATNPPWPRSQKIIDLFQQYNPMFEIVLIDGPHHLHMTHVHEVADHIERYFKKYLYQLSTLNIDKTKLDIPCIWGGTLTGVLVKSDSTDIQASEVPTTKIIGIHGWLDNLNSLLPLTEELLNRHPDYEFYLYDRAGHGFSSHIPKGLDYSQAHNLQDLRAIIQHLGWNKEKIVILGHSYGALLGITYAASYPNEIACLIAIDAIPQINKAKENFFRIQADRVDKSLQNHQKPPRNFEVNLTFEKAFELTKITRPGITDEAARLLTERSIRTDANNRVYFTRDEALKILSLVPFSSDMARDSIEGTTAPVLFIGATEPQWPRAEHAVEYFKERNPNFETMFIDGPHHLHMTHVHTVAERTEQFLNKHLSHASTSISSDNQI
ncbi:unnamed protein product [Adineta ricciae]|uniref:AB hydrolase-1 domain-containing protein n=1 Tax=Adineta ricciae TaxID=249248 RepID=A0A814MPN5_ADIRI|nr:unnamed protein product [Adineta ricciae]